MKAIEVNNLTKAFTTKKKANGASYFDRRIVVTKTAVDGISFCVDEGETLAFIGPNGAGKSTTIKMLTGILYPSGGNMSVLGLNPCKNRLKLSYKIGSVFGQKEQLWIHLTAYENFLFFGSIYDISKKEIQARIGEFSAIFDIADYMHQPVKSLSLGQRMKCEMVASLLHRPQMLFFDEPTIGLDPVAKETLRELIKKINKELGTTIFFTSHDVGDIEQICKRVIIINDGKIVLDDSMKNLKYNYLKKKIVEVKLSKAADFEETEGFKIIKCNRNSYEIEVDMTKNSVDKLLNMFNSEDIADISISGTPLEDIIKAIYKGNSQKAISINGDRV